MHLNLNPAESSIKAVFQLCTMSDKVVMCLGRLDYGEGAANTESNFSGVPFLTAGSESPCTAVKVNAWCMMFNEMCLPKSRLIKLS